MNINVGTRLGLYEIVSRIGAGGMGEVWRARDSRIGRDIAVKVLPASFSADADRLQRFEQEARAAGTLNHPNLVTIYELGTHEGAPFIAMELLEGETLRERLERGAIPARKTTEYAVQIANGLAAAHEKGIVHRDLKPENVFATTDGRIKILDFGLAKLTAVENDPDGQTAQKGTAPGAVMGTAGYMSPEQVRGQYVDYRTDIFAFGAMLYEMLSGHRAFKRDSSVETMNAILKEDPPELTGSGAHVSPALDRIIRRCLEKNANERFQSARDLAFALDALSNTSSGQVSGAHAVAIPPRRTRSVAIAAAATLALMAAVFLGGRASRPQPSQPTMRQLTFGNGTVRSARFAPDGQTIIYGAAWDGAPLKLFQRRLDGTEAVPLEYPDADLLAVSKKGELAISLRRTFNHWTTVGTLAKAPLLGSSFRKVLDQISWADWHPNGEGLAIVRRVGDEDRLEYPIGKILYRTHGFVSYPRFSPAGDRIAFLDHPIYADNRGHVSVVTLDGKKIDMLDDWSALEGLAWSPAGDEVWFSGTPGNGSWSINAVREGQAPRAVWRTPSDLVLHDVDRNGRVLVANGTTPTTIRALGRGEPAERDFPLAGQSALRALSADGKSGLLANYGGDASRYYDIYDRPLSGGPAIRLGEGEPLGFSADGKWALGALLGSPVRLMVYGTESESSREVNVSGLSVMGAAWFPGGHRLLLVARSTAAKIDCFLQDLDSGKRSRLPIEGAPSENAFVSPDGLKVAFSERGFSGASVYTIRGQLLRQIPGPLVALSWTSDSRALFVCATSEMPLRIQRLDVSTGALTPWKEIASPDMAGALGHPVVVINPDGDAYGYTIAKFKTDLFIVEGLQ
jgi:hypothetical protein